MSDLVNIVNSIAMKQLTGDFVQVSILVSDGFRESIIEIDEFGDCIHVSNSGSNMPLKDELIDSLLENVCGVKKIVGVVNEQS